jgi:hypothetical protein
MTPLKSIRELNATSPKIQYCNGLSVFFAFTNGENVSSDIVGAAAKKQGLPKVHMQWCHLVESGPLKSRPPKTKSTREKY